MKVAQIVYTMDMGGIETFVHSMAMGYNQNRVENFLLITSMGRNEKWCKQKTENLQKKGTTIIDVSRMRTSTKLGVLQQFMKTYKPDILLIHHEKMTAKILLLKMFTPCKFIQIQHSEKLKKSFFHRNIGKHIISHYVAVSKTIEKLLVSAYRLPAEIVSYIPNGIEIANFAKPHRKQKDNIVIGAAGRFVKTKNYEKLIFIFKQISEKTNKKVSFIITGDGEEKEKLASLLNKKDSINLVESITDMPSFYHSLDVYVSFSSVEGFSLSLLEAMASGCAIVVTKCSGNLQVITHNENGMLIEIEDSRGMFNTLLELINEPIKITRLGLSALTSAKQYDFFKTYQLYQSLINHL